MSTEHLLINQKESLPVFFHRLNETIHQKRWIFLFMVLLFLLVLANMTESINTIGEIDNDRLG